MLRNISKASSAAHMPFVCSVSPQFFGKESMEEVAGIRDIGNYFLVTGTTDPCDKLQASHPLREAKVMVEETENNLGLSPRQRLHRAALSNRGHGHQPVVGLVNKTPFISPQKTPSQSATRPAHADPKRLRRRPAAPGMPEAFDLHQPHADLTVHQPVRHFHRQPLPALQASRGRHDQPCGRIGQQIQPSRAPPLHCRSKPRRPHRHAAAIMEAGVVRPATTATPGAQRIGARLPRMAAPA